VTDETLSKLERLLIRHEGIKLTPYRCSLGFLTIGVGYNIDARGLKPISKAIGREVTIEALTQKGLTLEEAFKLLRADLRHFLTEIQARFPEFEQLDEVRQSAVVDFVFNLGLAGAAKFKTTLRFLRMALRQTSPDLKEACFTAAAFHAANSLWAQQVDDGLGRKFGRADRILYMLRTGEFSPK
jgi:lysozyme